MTPEEARAEVARMIPNVHGGLVEVGGDLKISVTLCRARDLHKDLRAVPRGRDHAR